MIKRNGKIRLLLAWAMFGGFTAFPSTMTLCRFAEMLDADVRSKVGESPDMSLPHAFPSTGPVRLFKPLSDSTRFATGILVELKDGREVLVLGGACSVGHEAIWKHIQSLYGDQVKEAVWWGEVEMEKSGGAPGPATIVRANETSGTFFKDKGVNHKTNDVDRLAQSLKRLNPNLILDSGLQHYKEYEKDGTKMHLEPFMVARHRLDNTMVEAEGMLLAALEGINAPRGMETFSKRFANSEHQFMMREYSKMFSEAMEGLENDGLISHSIRVLLSKEWDGLAESKNPSHRVATSLLQNILAIKDKLQTVSENPHDWMEVIATNPKP